LSVRIVVPAGLRMFTGNQEEIKVSGSTTGECLEELAARYPEIEGTLFFKKGKLFTFGYNKISIFLNGEDTHPHEMDKDVQDGDTIHIMLAIGGG
jgi:molybdopterin converting factor small subunit